jgi:hypothetical protein
LDVTCRLSDCAPRAVAVAGWATIAGVPAAIGLVVLAHHHTEGWRWWPTMALAALVGAPGAALIPGRHSSEIKWSAFDAAPGVDAFRASTRTAIVAATAGAIVYAVFALLALLSEPTYQTRSRRYTVAARATIALAVAASLATVLLQPSHDKQAPAASPDDCGPPSRSPRRGWRTGSSAGRPFRR